MIFSYRFDGTYKASKCLNPVQSTSKKDTLHHAADAETAEQPAAVDTVQIQDENSDSGNYASMTFSSYGEKKRSCIDDGRVGSLHKDSH